ncbi:MAG: TIGR03067 domain-containing protein [Planctomycetia bacterium]|nr:TIGR03067 domain-containing protein [Planctomycetia bacterium]
MTTLASADPPAATPPRSDLDKLQGYWKPLEIQSEGKAQMPIELMKQVTVVVDKSEYHLYFKEKELDKEGKPIVFRLALANIALDEKASPKTITFEFAEGPFKGQKRHGIYELAGNQLKMCYGPTDKPRPTKFESPAKSGYFLETWARQVK